MHISSSSILPNWWVCYQRLGLTGLLRNVGNPAQTTELSFCHAQRKHQKQCKKPCSLDNHIIICPWNKFLPSPLNLFLILGLRANCHLNFAYFLYQKSEALRPMLILFRLLLSGGFLVFFAIANVAMKCQWPTISCWVTLRLSAFQTPFGSPM